MRIPDWQPITMMRRRDGKVSAQYRDGTVETLFDDEACDFAANGSRWILNPENKYDKILMDRGPYERAKD